MASQKHIRIKPGTCLLAALLLFTFCTSPRKEAKKDNPQNIILMIGDGMGLSQLSAITATNNNTNLEKCKHIGFIKTSAADNAITDSSAGGTAIATGKKTKNHYLGIDAEQKALPSILHYAEQNQKATGLVATSSVTHATPASFVAHTNDRYDYEAIALDFLQTDVDIIIGGGLAHFNKRKDGLNLIDSLIKKNYTLVYTIDSLYQTKADKIAALLYEDQAPKFSEGRATMLQLASRKAIETLNKNTQGFFLMIEGSQIDWACHEKDLAYFLDEMYDFKNTIGEVLDFVEQDGNTLLIVTADHETGGLAITNANTKTGTVEGTFTSNSHTATMVPVFAFGPGAQEFTGIMENTDLFTKMYRAFGFKTKN